MKRLMFLLLAGIAGGVLLLVVFIFWQNRDGSQTADSVNAASLRQCLTASDLPPELGIMNDDDQWLCANRPQPPREYGIGVIAAGIRECYPEEAEPVLGNAIWVSPEGDDHQAGDEEHPLRTVTAALCRARPGQTIHIRPGVYQEAVAVGALGAGQGPPIVVRGEGKSPEDVVLDGGYWRSFAIGLFESSRILIENLTIQHYTDAGVYALSSERVQLRNLIVQENGRCSVDPDAEGEGFGVNLLGSDDILVENSRFEHNGPLLEPVLCGEVLGTGVNTFESSGVIRSNAIVHTRGGGILIEKSSGPFLIENNRVEKNDLLAPDNYWDAGVWIDESEHVEIRHNYFLQNWGGAGVMISDEERAYPRTSRHVTIRDNAIVGNFAGVIVWGYGVCPPPPDVVVNVSTLLQDNAIIDNHFAGEDHPFWCDPDFIGGMAPPAPPAATLYLPLLLQ